jgi:hypothetical protein
MRASEAFPAIWTNPPHCCGIRFETAVAFFECQNVPPGKYRVTVYDGSENGLSLHLGTLQGAPRCSTIFAGQTYLYNDVAPDRRRSAYWHRSRMDVSSTSRPPMNYLPAYID